MPKVPVQRLSIWRFKKGVTIDKVIRDDIGAIKSWPTKVGDADALLFTRQSPAKPVSWKSFVQTATGLRLDSFESQSASAVLAVKVGDRVMAMTYGYSRNWLERSAIERRFGMMVTLNAVDVNSLRSIDKEEFENIQRKTRTQTSAQSDIGQFGVDVQRDLLRSVTGRPTNTALAENLTGADNLAASVRVEAAKLLGTLKEFSSLSEKDDYKAKGYDWIDHFQREYDPVVLGELDQALVDDLRAEQLDHIFLAAPSTLDWQLHDGFLFARERADSAEKRDDLRIEEWRAKHDRDDITLDKLKSERIRRFAGHETQPAEVFSVYESIIYERKRGGFLYALTGAEWYKIEQSHVTAVEADLKKIKLCDDKLPPATKGEYEGAYNKRVAKDSKGKYQLLDTKTVMFGGGMSKIEVCDLLSDTKQFIHVKNHIKSATLSHLFAQGTVSAQCFRDSRFRDLAKKKCEPSHAPLFDGDPMPKDYEVIFAIISSSTGDIRDALPFFSKQSLVNAAQIITGLGHPLCIMRIDIAP